MSECENEPVSEHVSVFGSVFGTEYWFVCACEQAAFAWLGAVEMEGPLPLNCYRWAESCSETEAWPHYWGLPVQWDRSPVVKPVGLVADFPHEVSKLALEEVGAEWKLCRAPPVIESVEKVELVVVKSSVAAADIAQWTDA